jgi:hypothetical protein
VAAFFTIKPSTTANVARHASTVAACPWPLVSHVRGRVPAVVLYAAAVMFFSAMMARWRPSHSWTYAEEPVGSPLAKLRVSRDARNPALA